MDDLQNLLVPPFDAKFIRAAITHFANASEAFGKSDWEQCIAKSGKFVEAIVKAIGTLAQIQFELGRKFSAGSLLSAIEQKPNGSIDDSLRVVVPRACRLVYDIASNRGARHDPHEVDPNLMDANVVLPACSWILAEILRFSQRGAMAPEKAARIVEGLVEKKYPIVEVIEGRVYLHAKKKSAVDVMLVALAMKHPKRMSRDELIATAISNRFTKNNASVGANRIKKYVDEDQLGNMRLLATGREKADQIISTAIHG